MSETKTAVMVDFSNCTLGTTCGNYATSEQMPSVGIINVRASHVVLLWHVHVCGQTPLARA